MTLSGETIRPWIETETGMDLGGTRGGRLRDGVLRVLGPQATEADLHDLLQQPERRARFLEQVVSQLTVGETFFFRNEHHFQALREVVLPQIVADNAERRDVRMWSAGCATGEEPYSLAIVLDQVLGETPGWQTSILATDVNPEFLQRARAAVFRPWSFRQTQIHLDRQYFVPHGDAFRLKGRVRDWVRFALLNLVKDVYPSPLTGTVGLDLIVFRNVAIYLKPDVTTAILQRFWQALRPGGWLLLGEAELGCAATDGFEVRRIGAATFHQKPATPGAERVLAPCQMPVLATRARPTIPAVPELPLWVPLPTAVERPLFQPVSPSELPTWEQAASRGDWSVAERALAAIRDAKERARNRLRYARELLAIGEVTRARQSLELCLQDDPLSLEGYLLQASLAEEAGRLDEAERSYRKALYLDRRSPLIHFHLALVQQQRGDAAGAQRSLRTTLELAEEHDPHAVVEFGEGVCYGRLREMARAISA